MEKLTCKECGADFQPYRPYQVYCTKQCRKAVKIRNFPSQWNDKRRDNYLRKTYGIGLGEYNKLLEIQGGVCAICKTVPNDISLHVDHDHETGLIRGLLCFPCNQGIGNFHDSLELLTKASKYLNNSNQLRLQGITNKAEVLVAFKKVLDNVLFTC